MVNYINKMVKEKIYMWIVKLLLKLRLLENGKRI